MTIKDDRFVIKEMVNAWNVAEKDAFLKFAPKYFDHMKMSATVSLTTKPTYLIVYHSYHTVGTFCASKNIWFFYN